MTTKTYTARPDKKCCVCETAEAETRGDLFCISCLYDLTRRDNQPVRTYLDYERVGRKELDQSRFDWDYTDFDAECSLGGKPDYDAWFAPDTEDWHDT